MNTYVPSARTAHLAVSDSMGTEPQIYVDIEEEKLFDEETTDMIGYRLVIVKIYRSTSLWLFETANQIGDQIGCSLAIVIGKIADLFPEDLINMSALSEKKDKAFFTSPRVEVEYNDDMATIRINDDDNELLTRVTQRLLTINWTTDSVCTIKRTMKMDLKRHRFLDLESCPIIFSFDSSRMDIYWLLFYTYNSSLDIRLRVGRYEQRLVFRTKEGTRYKLPQPISKMWLLLTSIYEFKLKTHTPEQTIKENELAVPPRILITTAELNYISNWFSSKLAKWKVTSSF